VVIVNVDANPAAVPLAGAKLAVAPEGRPDSESPIVGSPELAEPGTSDSVTAYVFVPVVRTCWLVGLAATAKSYTWTTVVAVFDTAPSESVTVTAYVESPRPGVSVIVFVVANGAPFFVHA
jgi:hypothetical protein